MKSQHPSFRASFLAQMDRISTMPEQRDRMASIIGGVEALLDDDPELLEAVEKAFKGTKEEGRDA